MLAPDHEHLIEPGSRQLFCCCNACAILFSASESARFRRVPKRIDALTYFQISDSQWENLHLPINLAFFYRSMPANRVLAYYPSPAGAMESLLPLEAWQEIEAANTILGTFKADVEALLVNRVAPANESFRVPIDECYKLVGLLRTHWRGLSGGAEVWQEVGQFFESLRQRARRDGGVPHA